MFAAAYDHKGTGEFPTGEEMDVGFKRAREELDAESRHKRKRDLIARMQALTIELQSISFELQQIETRLSPKNSNDC